MRAVADRTEDRGVIRAATAQAAVTVVVPTYNSLDTLGATVTSIRAQTCDDFCVLIIDDGSAQPVPNPYSSDPRVHVYRLLQNTGYAGATNISLEMIASRWVIFVDADDTLEPECLETLVRAGEREQSAVVVPAITLMSPTGAAKPAPFSAPASWLAAPEALWLFISGRLLFNQHMLFRPSDIRAQEGIYSDMGFILRTLAAAQRVSFVATPLYNILVHAGSMTGQLRDSVWDLAAVVDEVRPTLQDLYGLRLARAAAMRIEWMQIQYMLSKAASDRHNPQLRRQVYRWCRSRISRQHLRDAMQSRHWAKCGSLVAARLSPDLHRLLYRLRDHFKAVKP